MLVLVLQPVSVFTSSYLACSDALSLVTLRRFGQDPVVSGGKATVLAPNTLGNVDIEFDGEYFIPGFTNVYLGTAELPHAYACTSPQVTQFKIRCTTAASKGSLGIFGNSNGQHIRLFADFFSAYSLVLSCM